MEVLLRSDSVEISGYVNAVGRESRPLVDRRSGERFVEVIEPGAFRRSLERDEGRRMLLNHRADRVLAEEGAGLELSEDPVGLFARAVVSDSEVIGLAAEGKLVGWSFGFRPVSVDETRDEGGVAHRAVRDLVLSEVSVISDGMTPCYEATSVFTRAEGDDVCFRAMEAGGVKVHDLRPKGPDPAWEERIAALRK